MEYLNINNILQREKQAEEIITILSNFEKNKKNVLFKKGIYVYGDPGTGKTTFVMNILKELNYDVIKYDAGDIRNKSVIEKITQHNVSDTNIISLFHKKVKKIAIVMDEIDGMNNGDKGGINSLIKLIRPKKTKKQKLEENTTIPIVCIGNFYIDKKIKELMKVCNNIELKTPTSCQIMTLFDMLIKNQSLQEIREKEKQKEKIAGFIQGDLRKLNLLTQFYQNQNENFGDFSSQLTIMEHIFQSKSYNDDTKKITQKLMQQYYPIQEHSMIMNETDRTIIGLLWHENVIDSLEKVDKEKSIPFYLNQLHNICFSDYIDRITFQKQIWQFNEMSSLVKTFKNNKAYHQFFNNNNNQPRTTNISKPSISKEIRFTKVLTKYSTEYNNSLFIQEMCQTLGMDKKDLFSFFHELKNTYGEDETKILELFTNYDISKLDIFRLYRYLERMTKDVDIDLEMEMEDVSLQMDFSIEE
jgi:DNA polymerase III delta prime subunit